MPLVWIAIGIIVGLTISCLASSKLEHEYQKEIKVLEKDRDSWRDDAIKYCEELGLKRIEARIKDCERCPREDTDCCRECVDPVEDGLRKVLDREAKRIKGDTD